MRFNVEVEKTYFSTIDPAETETITGTIPIEAISTADAVVGVNRMMDYKDGTCLQTNDRRIEWEDPTVLDDPDTRQYEDFSFKTTGNAWQA